MTIVYRLLSTGAPTEEDYLTYQDQGRPLDTDDAELVRMAQGYSVFVSLEAARAVAKRSSLWKRGTIAVYHVPESNEFVLAKTGKKAWHYTLWCESNAFRDCLRLVVPVREGDDDV